MNRQVAACPCRYYKLLWAVDDDAHAVSKRFDPGPILTQQTGDIAMASQGASRFSGPSISGTLRSRWKVTGGAIFGVVGTIFGVFTVVGSFRSAMADWCDVYTRSMKPTIIEGDRILINKLAYGFHLPFTSRRLVNWGDPQRSEIVAFFSPIDGTPLVKRVVGLPGDRIEMRSNRLYVNGRPAHYRDGDGYDVPLRSACPGVGPAESFEVFGGRAHPVMMASRDPECPFFEPAVVPAGSYFVLGDNRDESIDSRWFGFVPREKIFGRASLIAASINPANHYLPRWERFFQSLP